MIGLTMAAMLLAQDLGPRCQAIALRIERTTRVASDRIAGTYAAHPDDAEVLARIRQIRASQAIAKGIRNRYPGPAARIAEIERMDWNAVIAEGRRCLGEED
jgi:hypothetical protein